ncbi:MAG: glycoside hydrolase family 88 protein, partial [Clostridia bacterium]|nr:glycoside hydrolase family 88 protein [Clostridia bacterium]
MAYELTLRAGEGTLVRPQEYDYHWCYERGIITKAWLDVFEHTGEARFLEAAREDVDRFVTESGEIVTYQMDKFALDDVCMGRTALRLYQRTGQTKYKTAVLTCLEQLEKQPRTKEGGFFHKAVYPGQMWLDGIFMACPFLVEAGLVLNRPQLLQEAIRQMSLIYEKTLLPSGLHVHAWDSEKAQKWADPKTGRSQHVWGRAMGWYMMAYADILEILPEPTEGRSIIVEEFQKMARAVLDCMGGDGLFHQVMDMPENEENYGESSCTAMFCYSLCKGVRLGLL